jgi:hypothetical protein
VLQLTMSLTDIAIILQIVVAISSIIAAIGALLNRREIRNVHVEINSRMTELLKVAQRASHSEGIEAGRLLEEKRQGSAGIIE